MVVFKFCCSFLKTLPASAINHTTLAFQCTQAHREQAITLAIDPSLVCAQAHCTIAQLCSISLTCARAHFQTSALMSAKYCIFDPFNLYLLGSQFCSYLMLCVVLVFQCAKVLIFETWFKEVELSKEGIIAPVNALERKGVAIECICDQVTRENIESAYVRAQGTSDRCVAPECKTRDRAYSTYTRVFRVSLAAIVNLLAPWDFGAITCDQTHALQSSIPSLSRQHIFSINRAT